jgi:ABC-2 type transport system ATP-binding protein
LAGLDPVGIDAIGAVLIEQAKAGCCVLFSSHQLDLVEDLCEAVTIIDHGRVVAAGRVDDLAAAGLSRLVVRVEQDRDARWARALAGVRVSEVSGGAARLVLDEGVDSQSVLRAAMAAGRVTEFVFERRRLSEVFRDALR